MASVLYEGLGCLTIWTNLMWIRIPIFRMARSALCSYSKCKINTKFDYLFEEEKKQFMSNGNENRESFQYFFLEINSKIVPTLFLQFFYTQLRVGDGS